jgi:hypothetical protein
VTAAAAQSPRRRGCRDPAALPPSVDKVEWSAGERHLPPRTNRGRDRQRVVGSHPLCVKPEQNVVLADTHALAVGLAPVEPPPLHRALPPPRAAAAPCPLAVRVSGLHKPYPTAIGKVGVRGPVPAVHFVRLFVDDAQ